MEIGSTLNLYVKSTAFTECEQSKSLVGPSWSRQYGRWIYSYLCIQCLSPLKLQVRIPFMARCTRYTIMW